MELAQTPILATVAGINYDNHAEEFCAWSFRRQ